MCERVDLFRERVAERHTVGNGNGRDRETERIKATNTQKQNDHIERLVNEETCTCMLRA